MELGHEIKVLGLPPLSSDCVVSIVHKRFWHQKHHLGPTSPSLHVPAGFSECGPSVFAYDGCREEGERRLQQEGYTHLEDPFWLWDAMYHHELTPELKTSIICDTQEIRTLLEGSSTELAKMLYERRLTERFAGQEPDVKDLYARLMGGFFAPAHSLSFGIVYDWGKAENAWRGCEAYLMSEALERTLPPLREDF